MPMTSEIRSTSIWFVTEPKLRSATPRFSILAQRGWLQNQVPTVKVWVEPS